MINALGLLRDRRLLLCLAVLLGCWPFGIAQARNVQELRTPTGIGIWLVEERGVPLVAMGFAFRGGSAEDPAGKEGLGNIVAQMLDEGAGPYGTQAFKTELANVGANLTFTVSPRALSGGLVTLKKNLPKVAELLRHALHDPHLGEKDFERVREEEAVSLGFQERSPEKVALQEFNKRAFPAHPLGRPSDGTTTSLRAITYQDVSGHLKRLIDLGALHVVLVGDIDASESVRLVDEVFDGLPKRERRSSVSPTTPAQFDLRLPGTAGQAVEVGIFALPMPPLESPDFFAAMALNSMLGSGNLDALLTREVRVARGLTYSISSQLISDPMASYSLGLLTTQPGKMDEALAVVRDVYSELSKNGPRPTRLENTKSSLQGSYLLRIDTSAKLTNQLLGLWIDGLPPDYADRRRKGLSELDADSVARVAQKYFRPEDISTLVLVPPSEQAAR